MQKGYRCVNGLILKIIAMAAMLADHMGAILYPEAEVLREDGGRISVKILAIPSSMRSWVLSHLNSCEVTGPKSFREEIQQIVMEAYQAYTSIRTNNH